MIYAFFYFNFVLVCIILDLNDRNVSQSVNKCKKNVWFTVLYLYNTVLLHCNYFLTVMQLFFIVCTWPREKHPGPDLSDFSDGCSHDLHLYDVSFYSSTHWTIIYVSTWQLERKGRWHEDLMWEVKLHDIQTLLKARRAKPVLIWNIWVLRFNRHDGN